MGNYYTITRSELASQLGESFDGERNIYTSCGWPKQLDFYKFLDLYAREPMAKAVVSAYTDATWQPKPIVFESSEVGDKTKFEKSWRELNKRIKVFHYLNRADRISGIGSYGVLFFGFGDVSSAMDYQKPVKKNSELLYLRPFSEGTAKVESLYKDTKNPKYGYPEYYQLTFSNCDLYYNQDKREISGQTLLVHESRVLHLSEFLEEDNIYGKSRLMAVYNNIIDIRKILGCSAEMFWQGAFQGLKVIAQEDAELTQAEIDKIKIELQNYLNGMQRYLAMSGANVDNLNATIADPATHIAVQLDMISAVTGIPKRKLTGSESGREASTQDENSWRTKVDQRREGYATDCILRPFIERLIEHGVLASPKEDFVVVWPEITNLSPLDKQEQTRLKVETMARYVQSGSDILIPPDQFLQKVMQFSADDVTEFAKNITEGLRKEEIDENMEAMDADRFGRNSKDSNYGGNTPPANKPRLKEV